MEPIRTHSIIKIKVGIMYSKHFLHLQLCFIFFNVEAISESGGYLGDRGAKKRCSCFEHDL
jgi:hypothetical protein